MKIKKKTLLVMICIIILIVSAVTSYAWFWAERRIQTVAQIATPIQLYVSGGHKDDIEYINLGGIDTSTTEKQATFVFAVHGKDTEKYDLQLVHTTNIPFTYSIYEADDVTANENGGDITYVSPEDNGIYYYDYVSHDQLGGYMNQEGTKPIANTDMIKKGYEEYTHVQENAYPLFYLVEGIKTDIDTNNADEEFIDYYILQLNWKDTILSDKETDMVYLMVGAVDE